MDDIVERHLYAYKLDKVQLDGQTFFNEDCFISTEIRDAILFNEVVFNRAYIDLYLPRADLLDKFPNKKFSLTIPDDTKQKINVESSYLGLGFLEGSQYYYVRYKADCKDVEQAKYAVDLIKQQLVDRMNELKKKGSLQESMLGMPNFEEMPGSDGTPYLVYAYATVRKDEDKTYIVRKYLLPVSDVEDYKVSVLREFYPALVYLRGLPNFDRASGRIQDTVNSYTKYAIFEIPEETKAKTTEEFAEEKQKYAKLLSHDLKTMAKEVKETVKKIKQEYATTDEIVLDVSKKIKATMFVQKNLTYDPKGSAWHIDFQCYIPHELFANNLVNAKILSKEIRKDIGAGGYISNMNDLVFFRKTAMDRFNVYLPSSQSKEQAEQLYADTVGKIKTLVETQAKEKMKKIEQER